MIKIDGGLGEGGGQILRTALSLSAVTGKPFELVNIRAGRQKPGLQRQHLASVRAIAQICNAKVSGAVLGGNALRFEPSGITGGQFEIDVGSAGSVVLVAQAALPALFCAEKESELRIRGGTHVIGAPTYDYFEGVFLPALGKFGLHAEAKLGKVGFYPVGGGEIAVKAMQGKAKQADFSEIGTADGKIHAKIISSKLPGHVSEREKKEIEGAFWDSEIEVMNADAMCAGNAVTVWGGFLGACAIGKAGVAAEKVAMGACDSLHAEIGAHAAVDCHLADQLMGYLALAGEGRVGTSKITQHAKTNAEVISAFLPVRFKFGEKTIGLVRME